MASEGVAATKKRGVSTNHEFLTRRTSTIGGGSGQGGEKSEN